MKAFFAFFLLASMQPAWGREFISPGAKFAEAKAHTDCGGKIDEDLSPQMPEVENQLNSPWCVSFNAKALLDHLYRDEPSYRPISVTDFNAIGSSDDGDPFQRKSNFLAGNSMGPMLERVQSAGALASERDLPFSTELFDPKGLLAKLSTYYSDQKIYTKIPGALECRDPSSEVKNLEKQFTDLLAQLKKYDSSDDFLKALDETHRLFPSKPNIARSPLIPNFDFHLSEPSNGDAWLAGLSDGLKKGRPVGIAVCANQLNQLPELKGTSLVPPQEMKACGDHQLTVVGMKVQDGECKVLVRNSWGIDWPRSGAGGHIWLSSKKLSSVLAVGPDSVPPATQTIQVSKRSGAAKAQNSIKLASGNILTGETKDLRLHGEGEILAADGSRMKGAFTNGQLIDGTNEGTFNPGTKFKGTVKNGFAVDGEYDGPIGEDSFYHGQLGDRYPEGKGRLQIGDGKIFDGIFSKGMLTDGKMRIPDQDGGDFYREYNIQKGSYNPKVFKKVDGNGKPR